MANENVNSIERNTKDGKELLSSSYRIKSLCKSKADKRKLTKDAIAFCCSKSGLDERDINQCTHTVI